MNSFAISYGPYDKEIKIENRIICTHRVTPIVCNNESKLQLLGHYLSPSVFWLWVQWPLEPHLVMLLPCEIYLSNSEVAGLGYSPTHLCCCHDIYQARGNR